LKKLALFLLLAFSSSGSIAETLDPDTADCALDALNYTSLATLAAGTKEKSTYDTVINSQLSLAKSKEQAQWILEASKMAWEMKGKASPVYQGFSLFKACIKDITKT
jgi:hypothetical protein